MLHLNLSLGIIDYNFPSDLKDGHRNQRHRRDHHMTLFTTSLTCFFTINMYDPYLKLICTISERLPLEKFYTILFTINATDTAKKPFSDAAADEACLRIVWMLQNEPCTQRSCVV